MTGPERTAQLPPIAQQSNHNLQADLQTAFSKSPEVSNNGEIDKKKWITLPQLGESTSDARVMSWLKQPGDWVEKYEPVAEVETDKVTTEIPSPFSGFFKGFVVEPDTSVPFGTPLCWIEEGDRPQEGQPPKEKDTPNNASDIDKESQKNGDDNIYNAEKFIPEFFQPIPQTFQKHDHVLRVPIKVFPGDEIIPLTPMRRQIAEHMVRSERTAPHATAVMETDMTNIVAYRNQRKEKFLQQEGIELTYLPFAIKAATLALRDNPRLNAVFDEDKIIHRKAMNIGIAVALEDGLIVPVIKNADRLSIAGIAHAVSDLTKKAREGTLTPDDVTGGTFTVNNPGTFGTLVSTPIIVQPQVGILSTEKVEKRPVVIDDMIAVRSMMNMSLSIDHRAVDGLGAARFLQQIKQLLESVNERTPLY